VHGRSFEEFLGLSAREKGRKLAVASFAAFLTAAKRRGRAMSTNIACSPPFNSIAKHAAKLYACKNLYLENDTLVVFACGANINNPESVRELLLAYAIKRFRHGTMFRAEDAFRALSPSSDYNLLTIEHELAEYSDCVVVISESPGAFAELGAFASNEKVVKKILVVIPKMHAISPSFINMGPIAYISKKSIFKEAICIDLSSASINFDDIIERIERTVARRRRLRVDYSANNAWCNSEGKLRLLLLQDIINLYCPMKMSEILPVLRTLFPKSDIDFDIELSLLVALKRVVHRDDLLITQRCSMSHNYTVQWSGWLKLRKKIIDLYRDRASDRLKYLKLRHHEVI